MKISQKIAAYISTTAILVTLTACSTPTPYQGPTMYKNKVQVAESIERLELYTRPSGLELSARDQVAVRHFVQDYGRRGQGPLYINVPSAAAQGIGTQQAKAVIRQSLSQVGLGGAAVQTGQYQSQYGLPAPVVVSYRTLKTVPQDCREAGDLSNSYGNDAYLNYGCSHTANLAAMIGDPRQLIEPYEMTIPDSQRRQVVYDKYIEGENPASDHPDRQENTVE